MKKLYMPTQYFILTIIALVTGYDLWALYNGYDRTISYALASEAYKWPIIPFIFGVFAGHLFFSKPPTGENDHVN